MHILISNMYKECRIDTRTELVADHVEQGRQFFEAHYTIIFILGIEYGILISMYLVDIFLRISKVIIIFREIGSNIWDLDFESSYSPRVHILN